MSYLKEAYDDLQSIRGDEQNSSDHSSVVDSMSHEQFLSLSIHKPIEPKETQHTHATQSDWMVTLDSIDHTSGTKTIVSHVSDSSQSENPHQSDDSTPSNSSNTDEVEHHKKSSPSSDQPHPNTLVKKQIEQFGLNPLELSIIHDQSVNSSTQTISEQADSLSSQMALLNCNSDLVIRQLLGSGGMGMVFDGYQTCLNREVAFKISKNYNNLTPKRLAQICHEAQITAKLSHARIPPVYVLAVTPQGEPIQVMKKIEGVSWNRLLRNPQDPFWQELGSRFTVDDDEKEHPYLKHIPHKDHLYFHLNVLLQVAQAMAYTHSHSIIHRDLKPENVMVGPYGEIHVLDWGVAIDLEIQKRSHDIQNSQKISQIENSLVGTPAYMPPEMARKRIDEQGPWSDVFQLGAILWQIWTDQLLYNLNDQSLATVLRQIEQGDMPEIPSELPIEAQLLLFESLHPDPQKRIADAHTFTERLTTLIHSLESKDMEWRGRESLEEAWNLTKGTSDQTSHSPQEIEAYNHQVDFLLDQARYFFWSATQLWPANKNAAQGIEEVLAMWVPILVTRNELSCAERLLRSVSTSDENLMQIWKELPAYRQRFKQKSEQKFQRKIKWLSRGLTVSCITSILLVIYIMYS